MAAEALDEARHATRFTADAARRAVRADTIHELVLQQYTAPAPHRKPALSAAPSQTAAALQGWPQHEIARPARRPRGDVTQGYGERPNKPVRGRAAAPLQQPETGLPAPLPGLPPPRTAAAATEAPDTVANHVRSTVGDIIFGGPPPMEAPDWRLQWRPPRQAPPSPPSPERGARRQASARCYHGSRWAKVEPRVMAWRTRPTSAPSGPTGLLAHQQPGRLKQLREWQSQGPDTCW